MRHRVVLPLVLLLVAGCGGAEPSVSVPGAATSLATTTRLEAGDALLAATVDAAGAPVMVVDDGGTSPVLRRGRDTGSGTVVGLVGTSAVQSIWAISVAPDDSVVMIADGHSGTAVVRVDPAGSMTRYPVDLHTDPARAYGSRHPMRTYAALTADASTAVLLTVPEQPRTSVTPTVPTPPVRWNCTAWTPPPGNEPPSPRPSSPGPAPSTCSGWQSARTGA